MHDVRAPIERSSIKTAVRHRRIGCACSEAIVTVALVLSICALLFAMSVNAAYAAPAAGELIRFDHIAAGAGTLGAGALA